MCTQYFVRQFGESTMAKTHGLLATRCYFLVLKMVPPLTTMVRPHRHGQLLSVFNVTFSIRHRLPH